MQRAVQAFENLLPSSEEGIALIGQVQERQRRGEGDAAMNFPLGQGLANASDHLCQRFVTIGPAGDGFVVTRKRLELSQWGVFPIHRAHEDGDNTGCTGLMSL